MSQSRPTIRSILLVDVENSCHTYVKGVRCYSDSLLVIFVVPKSYDETKLANLKPEIQPIATASSTSSSSYSTSFEHRHPRNDWVWLIRAASDEPQAVDIQLQSLAEWCIRSFNHRRTYDPSDQDEQMYTLFECPIKSPTHHLKKTSINQTVALFIVAGNDLRYRSLVPHLKRFNSQIQNSCINEISFRKGGDEGVFSERHTLDYEEISVPCCTGWNYSEKTTGVCHVCKIIFSTADASRSHCREIHPFCQYCRFMEPTREAFQKHASVQRCTHKDKVFGTCGRITCAVDMERHFNENHAPQIKAEKEEAARRERDRMEREQEFQERELRARTCPCGTVFKTATAKDQHWNAKKCTPKVKSSA